MMLAAREPLRSWFYRPWLLAMCAAVLSAALLLAASLGIAMHEAQLRESEQMNAQGQRFLERLEQLFGQLREGLDVLEAQPLRECSPEMVVTLQQISFSYRFIYEAAYIDAAQACTNWPLQDNLAVMRPPDIRGPTYSYWLNTSTEPNENRAALMLGRGNFRVATSRGHLTDMVDLPANSSLMVVLDHGSRAIPVLGPALDWPPTEPWPPIGRSPLLVTQDQLIYRMPTSNPEYQMVLVTPRTNMQREIFEGWWWLLPSSLVLAVFIGGLA
ncbi:CSS-motif domain-containing protein, partial [Pseudomonas chlororaphis]